MAYCARCGREISEAARACPACGQPNELLTGYSTGAYAGFWTRFAALLLDGMILVVPATLLGPLGGFTTFVYQWLMIALNRGQTLGKMALGIRITHPDGSPLDLGEAAGRAGMAIVSGLALGIGYLWVAWDAEHRTWHDMVMNSRAFVAR